VREGGGMVQGADMDVLERLMALKTKGVISDIEFEIKKREILAAKPRETRSTGTVGQDGAMLGHGISVLVGACILLLVSVAQLGGDTVSQDQLDVAAEAIFLLGAWIIPHSIWTLTRAGANRILPIVALGITGVCGLAYAGST
jgi:hypothetical protein